MMLRFKTVMLWAAAAVLMACRPFMLSQPADAPTVTPQPASQPAAVQAMQMLMRGWLGEPVADALPVDARQVDWPDSCFGAGYAYESCAQAITPGWEMTFVVEGQRYTFRTDAEAARYRLVEAPPADIGETIISWSGAASEAEGGCLAAEIGAKAVAFGDCGGALMAGRFANAANRRLLDQHVARFATFKADGATTGGQTLVFTGRGVEMPTPADQRAIAELARLMALEARSGRAGASWVTAIALRQETTPDRTAMCVSVEMTGQVYVNPCAANAPGQALFLNPSGLDQLYRWVDELSLFDLTVTDKEVVTQIVFGGRGARPATEAEQDAIRAFAAGLIGEAREQQPDLSAGQARYALPLVLPEGLDWNPDAAEASDRSFRARAEDPANPQSRWVEVRGALDALPRPDAPATPVALRGTDGAAYDFAEGFVVMWVEDGTHYAVSASFGLTETVDIAGSLAPMTLEMFEQIMRERRSSQTDHDSVGIAARLEQALAGQDFVALQSLMGDPFIIGYWRSEGVSLTPAEAVEELRRNHLGASATLTFERPVNLPGFELPDMLSPDVRLAQAVLVKGWGSDGQGEAVLLIGQAGQGPAYWHSVIVAMNGFAE